MPDQGNDLPDAAAGDCPALNFTYEEWLETMRAERLPCIEPDEFTLAKFAHDLDITNGAAQRILDRQMKYGLVTRRKVKLNSNATGYAYRRV